MLVDFHMHSIYSDGLKLQRNYYVMHRLNLSMMALTDHDEIDGIKALRTATNRIRSLMKPLKL